jgi:hypothetical protein
LIMGLYGNFPNNNKFDSKKTHLQNRNMIHTPKIFRASALLALAVLIASSSPLVAALVTLQNPTATFSQTSFGGFSVAGTLGNPTSTSWAVFDGAGVTSSQSAVWETQSDTGFLGGTHLTMTISHTDATVGISSQPSLGRFRLSYTTDDRSTFADGLSTGGDVTAAWTILNPASFSSDGGNFATELGDLSLLVSGGSISSATYTVTASTTAVGITGFRLEALADPSLPTNGPGRHANGNFHVSQFTVDASPVPEPSSVLLLSFVAIALALGRSRR